MHSISTRTRTGKEKEKKIKGISERLIKESERKGDNIEGMRHRKREGEEQKCVGVGVSYEEREGEFRRGRERERVRSLEKERNNIVVMYKKYTVITKKLENKKKAKGNETKRKGRDKIYKH